MKSKHFFSLFVVLLMSVATASAQIDSGGVVNAAGFQLSSLPNGNIAQGSIFAVFSTQAQNIGPAVAVPVPGLPLPAELGGTSVRVTVDGITRDCFLFFTSSTQVLALLPSNTPLGMGEIEVTFGGQTFTEPIEVVERSFGIFTQNAAGTGAAIMQEFPLFGLNQLTASIEPGGVGILWGTGLGAVEGDEAAGPLGGVDLGGDVEVYVGGVRVTNIIYRGRGGCQQCLGVDQINFFLPAGVTGCYVPIVVVVNGIPSNYATISVAAQGEVCEEPGSFSSEELQQLLSGDSFRMGNVSLSRVSTRFSIPDDQIPGLDFESVSDIASGSFTAYSPQSFQLATVPFNITNVGSCWVFTFRSTDAEAVDPISATGLEAGSALALSGPMGSRTIPRIGPGAYSEILSSSTGGLPIPIPVPGGDPPFLEPGPYTISGPGGADVGPFTSMLNVPDLLMWTNQADITMIDRSQGVTVTWSGGNATTERVSIFGSSIAGTEQDPFGAGFFCTADINAGSFTVGPEVLGILPPSVVIESFAAGFLQVGSSSIPVPFEATGLDFGCFSYSVSSAQNVQYK